MTEFTRPPLPQGLFGPTVAPEGTASTSVAHADRALCAGLRIEFAVTQQQDPSSEGWAWPLPIGAGE